MMELVRFESDETWDALLEAQPDGSLYHTSAWLNFQARQFGFDLHRLAIRDASGPVGLFPLFLAKRTIFRVAASPRGVDYLNLGPLVGDAMLGETLDAYERWAREHRVDFTSVAFMREVDEDVATRRGYKCERHLTALADLRGGEEAMFARCKSSCRRAIRKAAREGVTIVEGDIEPHLDLYLRLSTLAYAKSGAKSPLSGTTLRGMLAMLRGSGRLLTLRAEVDGKVVGMYVVGHYGKTGYSLDIVADYEFAPFRPSNLLTWHAMRWCARRGLETFDMGGARFSSIARFKTSFGAVITPYTNITKAHSLLARSVAWVKDATVDRIRAARTLKARTERQHARKQSDDQEGDN